MKVRRYTQGVTVFMEPKMYEAVKLTSDERGISLSEIFREMVTEYLIRRNGVQPEKKIENDRFGERIKWKQQQ